MAKKFVVTYPIAWAPMQQVNFKYETENAHELYKAVSAIIMSNSLMFPNRDDALDNWFQVCADIASGKSSSYIGPIFGIERTETPSDDA